jgi:hypothetical protein
LELPKLARDYQTGKLIVSLIIRASEKITILIIGIIYINIKIPHDYNLGVLV